LHRRGGTITPKRQTAKPPPIAEGARFRLSSPPIGPAADARLFQDGTPSKFCPRLDGQPGGGKGVDMGGVSDSQAKVSAIQPVSFAEAARYWVKLGFINFGGPAGQIAMMQHECVDRRRWIDQGTFLHALNYCMLLPGPEAQQLAAYIGWRLHGIKGAVVAGTAFIVPGTVLVIFLSWLAAAHGETTLIKAAFDGIKPVVIAIVLQALWRIGRRTCNTLPGVAMAAAAFIALYFLGAPFPAVIAAAGVIGMAAPRIPGIHFSAVSHGSGGPPPAHAAVADGGSMRRLAIIIAVFVVLWAAPVGAVIAAFGTKPFADVAELFTIAAFVTFGGAYAVLPYIADAGVNAYQWLMPADMINGLALAETTPGPLIKVTTYVGFFAGWNGAAAAGLVPWLAAVIAALLTTYVTFLPSFLFIIGGAPYIEKLQTLAWAKSALAAITAAVVGVILNLTVFFGRAVLFPATGIDWIAAAAAAIAFALLASGRVTVPWLVAIGAAYGLVKALVI
jgi:chromate transporter